VAYLDNDFEGQRLRVVGEGCGRGLWERVVGEGCGRGLWERVVGEGCGRGLKERPGLEFWSKKTRDLNAKRMTGVEG
jgi:hypothetical protein